MLVFADDFSTDPNTNGLWTIHRKVGDPTSEAAWDPTAQVWHLTRPAGNRAAAVFANYDLTATDWKAQFRYKVAGDADGSVFMFYKDKDAMECPTAALI